MPVNRINPLPVLSPSEGLSLPSAGNSVGIADVHPAQPVIEGEPAEPALLQALKRRWCLALILGLVVGAGGAGAVWFVVPARYTTRAVLQVSSQPAQGLFTPQQSQESPDDFLAHQRTQAAIIKGREVIQAALRQPQVANRPEFRGQSTLTGWLADNLKVDSTLGPELLSVSLSGDRPEELPILVNAVVAAYLQELANKDRSAQPARLDRLQENYRVLEANLRRKRTQLRDLETNLGIDPPQIQMLRYQTALTQRVATEKELMQTTTALKSAQLELVLLNDTTKESESLDPLLEQQLLLQDAHYQALVTRKALLEEETGRIRGIAARGAQEQMLQEPQSQIATIDRELAARQKVLRPALRQQSRARLTVKVPLLQEQQKDLTAEMKRQEDEVRRLSVAIRQPDKPTSELEALRDEVAQAESVLKKVGEQRELLKVEPLVPPRVSLLEAADVPEHMDVKRQATMAGLAGGGLMVLVVLGICLWDLRGRRVSTEEDAALGTGLSLIGTLPVLPASLEFAGVGSRNALYEQALVRISLDALCARLFARVGEESPRVVLITSAEANEGKAPLALHLAARVAQGGRRTLLIDGDLLAPELHHSFDLANAPGFSELLEGTVDLPAVVRSTPLECLRLLTAGQGSDAAIMALAEPRTDQLFDLLREHFDFVIVNAGPVLTGPNVFLLGKQADTVVLSVLSNVSRLSAVQESGQALARMGLPVLGTILSGGSNPAFTNGPRLKINGQSAHFEAQRVS